MLSGCASSATLSSSRLTPTKPAASHAKAIALPGSRRHDGVTTFHHGTFVDKLSCFAIGSCIQVGAVGDSDDDLMYVTREIRGYWQPLRTFSLDTLLSRRPTVNAVSIVGAPTAMACATSSNCLFSISPVNPWIARGTNGNFLYPEIPLMTQIVNGAMTKVYELPNFSALGRGAAGAVSAISCSGPGDCVVAGQVSCGGQNAPWQVFFERESKSRWSRPQLLALSTREPGKTVDEQSSLVGLACSSTLRCRGVINATFAHRSEVLAVNNFVGPWSVQKVISNTGINGYGTGFACNSLITTCIISGTRNQNGAVTSTFVASELRGRWHRASSVLLPAQYETHADGVVLDEVACAPLGRCVAVGHFQCHSRSLCSHFEFQDGKIPTAIKFFGVLQTSRGPTTAAVLTGLDRFANDQKATVIISKVGAISCPSQSTCVIGYASDATEANSQFPLYEPAIVTVLHGSVFSSARIIPGSKQRSPFGNPTVDVIECESKQWCTISGTDIATKQSTSGTYVYDGPVSLLS